MMNQKELKEKYMNIIKTEVWQNDEHMQEFARKECEYVVELSNGNIIDIDKPRIEKISALVWACMQHIRKKNLKEPKEWQKKQKPM